MRFQMLARRLQIQGEPQLHRHHFSSGRNSKPPIAPHLGFQSRLVGHPRPEEKGRRIITSDSRVLRACAPNDSAIHDSVKWFESMPPTLAVIDTPLQCAAFPTRSYSPNDFAVHHFAKMNRGSSDQCLETTVNRLAPLRICPPLPLLSFQSQKRTAAAFEFFG